MNVPEIFSGFMIIVISFILYFMMHKVIPFSKHTTPLPRIYLLIGPSIVEADATVANSTKAVLTKGIVTMIN